MALVSCAWSAAPSVLAWRTTIRRAVRITAADRHLLAPGGPPEHNVAPDPLRTRIMSSPLSSSALQGTLRAVTARPQPPAAARTSSSASVARAHASSASSSEARARSTSWPNRVAFATPSGEV